MSNYDTNSNEAIVSEAPAEEFAEEIIVAAEKIKKFDEERANVNPADKGKNLSFPVQEIINNLTVEEIIENAKEKAMATKANKAAIQIQVNEAVKKAENADNTNEE